MTMTIDLPTELQRKAEQTARARGVSLDELIREALEWTLPNRIATMHSTPTKRSIPVRLLKIYRLITITISMMMSHDIYRYRRLRSEVS